MELIDMNASLKKPKFIEFSAGVLSVVVKNGIRNHALDTLFPLVCFASDRYVFLEFIYLSMNKSQSSTAHREQ